MAEILAVEYFGVTAPWQLQSTSLTASKDNAVVLKPDGDFACEEGTNELTDVSSEYTLCITGSEDYPSLLDTFGEDIVLEGGDKLVPTGGSINFNAGQHPTMSLNGRIYGTNVVATMNNYDIASVLPTLQFGSPTIMTGDDIVAPNTLSISFSVNHVVAPGADGNPIIVQNITARVEASESGIGEAEAFAAGWTEDSITADTSNTEFDAYSGTAHRHVVRN
jgi:hypothetical protein